MNRALLPELVLVEDSLDDEILSLRGISRSGIPCNVTVKREGDLALDHLLNTPDPLPTLILLDYQLPGRNGMEILTELRRNPRTSLIPVVIVSGTNSGSTLAECYRIGANSCVVKPDDPTLYIERIASIAHYWLSVNHVSRTVPSRKPMANARAREAAALPS